MNLFAKLRRLRTSPQPAPPWEAKPVHAVRYNQRRAPHIGDPVHKAIAEANATDPAPLLPMRNERK